MSTATVSAPAKLVLLGDHAVVYGRPCIVAAVEPRMTLSVSATEFEGLSVSAPDIGLDEYHRPYSELATGSVPKQAEYIEYAVHEFLKTHPVSDGIHIRTSSEIDDRFGFGTSAAALAATVFALDRFFKTERTTDDLFQIAYRAMHTLKGLGSGLDIAASLYGSVLYFVTGGKETERIDYGDLRLLAVYSGNKADTPTIVRQVASFRKENPVRIDALFDASQKLVVRGRRALESNDMTEFGVIMNEHQELLAQLGVSTPEIDRICTIAVQNHAYGAKLSGAGGGDCVIVSANNDVMDNLMTAFEAEGFESKKIAIAKDGVR